VISRVEITSFINFIIVCETIVIENELNVDGKCVEYG
jgi:hypothetical protein